MYQVILADSERAIHDQLRSMIAWEQEGFCVAGSCTDGVELVKLAAMNRPDLVILDVQLDGISGLEAARRIRASYPRAQLIFLTGCTEFECARKAVELQAVQYLVKPADADTLTAALRDARAHLDAQFGHTQKLAMLEHFYRRNRAMLLEELLCGMADTDVIYQRAQALGLDWNGNTWFQTVALSLQPADSSRWQPEDREAMVYALYNITAELLEEEKLGMACIRGELVVAVACGPDRERLEQQVSEQILKILDITETQLQFMATAGVSESQQDCAKLPALVSMAQQTLELQNRYGVNRLFTTQDLDNQDTMHKTVWNAITYIEKTYADPELSASAVSRHLHVSPGYLRTLFKRETGSTIVGFITKIRMEKARELLSDSKVKSRAVAEQVGYANPRYFSYCFRRYYGVTPAEAKERLMRREELGIQVENCQSEMES